MKISEELDKIMTWDLMMLGKIDNGEDLQTIQSDDELVLIASEWLKHIIKFERENEKTN